MNNVNIGKVILGTRLFSQAKVVSIFLFVCEFFTDNYYSGNIWTVGIDKCRRYIYQHVTLKEQPFSYKEQVVPFLLACYLLWWFIFSVFLFCRSTLCARFIPVCSLDLGIPCMAVKSLQYQANMTSLMTFALALTAQ